MARRRYSDEEAAAEAEVQHLLKTEGIKAAAAAMVAVCNDPGATAQAKATASRTIFEVTGSLKKDRDRGKDDIEAPTAEELNKALANIERMQREYDDPPEEDDQGDDLFG